MKAGDIYLVETPGSNGHEQQGFRPAIIVQTAINIDKVPTILVVPFTTQIKAASFPFTFIVEPDLHNNLASKSVALVFQLRAIDKKRLKTNLAAWVSMILKL
ncbi:MAG: type II toxin-antitoxin system PemK/MazF family toxin [Candidatus Loosdrechtia sp.]|uniref:type II toxin-antitoxin system PemK/MazF family toxin n=1 Tax=Candidatus Loosdrechtia sp. TaxID=3101272 RepID=UPI003A7697D7|nr:MAG: type II toxin-antitoxin system PemK/MazF family toxin [Candidatus Jettenia sp. AMX2]